MEGDELRDIIPVLVAVQAALPGIFLAGFLNRAQTWSRSLRRTVCAYNDGRLPAGEATYRVFASALGVAVALFLVLTLFASAAVEVMIYAADPGISCAAFITFQLMVYVLSTFVFTIILCLLPLLA